MSAPVPSPLAHGSPSDPLAPAHCDASPAPATADQSAPAEPAFGHPADHPFFDSLRSSAHCAHAPRSLHVPVHSIPDSPMASASPTHPWRVRPRFQRHPAARHPTEDFLHGLRPGRHFLFQNYFSRLIQYAVPTPSVSQIQPDRQFLTYNFFDLLCRCSANLLHCRSPLSPCASSASITWELIASRRRPAFSSHLVSPTTLGTARGYDSGHAIFAANGHNPSRHSRRPS